MANLKSLIKFRKHVVEQKQKVLGELFRQAEQLEARKKFLTEQLQSERAIAEDKNEYETYASFILFADGVRRQIEDLDDHLKELNQKILKAQEDMREAFGEQKKIELIQKAREEEDKRELDRKDSLFMDEIGVEGHRRKGE